MNYKEAMEYIKNTAKFGMNLGLERTEKILELLGNPHKKIKTVHVAGTNGKGSTTSMITDVLIKAKYKVGMYTSPYIEEFEERIQIDRKNINKEELAFVVSEVSKAVKKVLELGYSNPTEFEIITCSAFLYFYIKKVDIAIIEVGLGGRFDSTNVITPILTVITSISLDHTKILGDTIDKIAYEKAGIIKSGVNTICSPQREEAEKVIERVSKEKASALIKVPKASAAFISAEGTYQNIKVKTGTSIYDIKLSLLGKHQLINCATALYAIEELKKQGYNVKREHVNKALKEVKWPGRLEILKYKPIVVIDGAHNLDGIKKLYESIDMYFKYKKIVLIIGILKDKDVENMISTIVKKAYKVIAVSPKSERAESALELQELIKKYNYNCEAIEEYELAYESALSYCDKDDLLLICGSLYTIGEMRKVIRSYKK